MGLNIVEKYHVKNAMMNTYWSEWGAHLVLFLPQFYHCCLGDKPFLTFVSKTFYLAFLLIMQDNKKVVFARVVAKVHIRFDKCKIRSQIIKLLLHYNRFMQKK